MHTDDHSVLLVRRGGVTLIEQRSADHLPLGSIDRFLVTILTGRLLARRAVDYGTLVSECLPSRSRDGVAPDTSLHDLLAEDGPGTSVVLRRCLEAVGGAHLDRLVDEEVIGPAGLVDTRWEPATTTAADLDRLLCALDADALVPSAVMETMRQRGYGLSPVGEPPPEGRVLEIRDGGTGIFALRSPSLDLTIVAADAPPAA